MWEELYEDHYKELVAYGTRMSGSKELAEDLVQETFVKAHEHGNNSGFAPQQAAGMAFPYLQKSIL